MYSKIYLPNQKISAKYSLQCIMAIVLASIILATFSPLTANAQSQCAVDVILVIDRSGSMRGDPFTAAQAAANNFINQMNLPPSQVGLVSFNANATLDITLTSNGTAVQNQVSNLTAGGSTNIAAGITTAAGALSGSTSPVMILLTDGQSNATAAATAAANAQANGIRIIAIGLGNNVNTNLLQNQIASAPTDYYASPTPADLQQIYNDILQAICPGRICGMKYNDLNGNGSKSWNEPGLSGWQIVATSGSDSHTAATGRGGNYCIEVPAGTYTISEIQQSSWVQTAPAAPGTHSVTVQAGQTVNNIDFGNRRPNVTIQGHKFWDVNGNGIRDQVSQVPGVNVQEPLLDGFSFTLYSGNPNNTSTWSYVAGPVTINNANQGYVFTDIPPGTYFIREDAVSGWTQTAPSQNNGSHVFTVNGQHISGLDFGNRPCPAPCGDNYIMGFKFRDSNYNGVWDSNEANLRVGGVTIELLDAANNVIQTTATDSTGLYYFLGINPGTYTVREQVPNGWIQTVPGNGGTHTVTISNDKNGIGLNFGNYRCNNRIIAEPEISSIDKKQIGLSTSPDIIWQPKGCVTGSKFNDENRNGVRDNGEGPLEGFDFKLQSIANPANVYFTTSDASGNFRFVVPPDTYILSEIGEFGWSLTTPATNEHVVTVTSGGIASGFEFGNCTCGGPDYPCGLQDITISTTPPSSVTVGEEAVYTLDVQNVSRYATNAPTTVYFSLPNGVDLAEGGASSRSWSCTSEYSRVQCVHGGSINPRSTSTLQLTVLVGEDNGTEIQSCATAVVKDDANFENDSMCVVSEVIQPPSSSPISLYFSSSSSGYVSGVSFRDEDILAFNPSNSAWSLYFDGSDVGLSRKDVDAFHILPDGNILFSLNAPQRLGRVTYDDSDIIKFTASSLGNRTRGSFSMYFDGSDVQLTSSSEDIDAIALLSNGDLVLSTLGTARVSGVTARDEDMLRFHKTQYGNNTQGSWSLYLDGSDIGLTTSSEDIWAAGVASDDAVQFSTYYNYRISSSGTSLRGDSDDIIGCRGTLGTNTRCSLDRSWNGDNHSFGRELIDGYSVGPAPALMVLSAAADENDVVEDELSEDEDSEVDDILDDDEYVESVYLPLINR